MTSILHALATTALIALTCPALAQNTSGRNIAPAAEGAPAGGATTMGLAQDLYTLGVAQGDALTVLSAAKLAASVQITRAEVAALDPARITFAEGDQKGFRKTAAPTAPTPLMADKVRPAAKTTFFTATSEDEGAADAPATADAMFAKARDLAADDEVMLGLIDDTVAEGSRVRMGGAVTWLSRLPAGQTDVWELPFHGNSHAEIAVVGDGDTNLDIVITDESGNVFCDDVSWSNALYCDFTPARDGYFYVTVQNMGGVANSYYLMTN